MDFITKLIPFTAGTDLMMSIWVMILIAVFFISIFWILIETTKIKKVLKKSLIRTDLKKIKNFKLLKRPWEDYSNTFFEFEKSQKTDEYAYEFFNEKTLLDRSTNVKLINSIPNTLTGLGILGTFIGLAYGISNFDTTSTTTITESISTLLSGMSTAFVTSIWGMSLAIIFTFFDKHRGQRMVGRIHQLCYILDRIYKLKKSDARKLEQQFFIDFFGSKNEEGKIIKPGNIYRDLYKEATQQTTALKSFSTDLATTIEAGFERILSDQFNSGFIPAIELLQEEIKALGEKFSDPATEMTENVIMDLQDAIGKMVDEVKNSISGSTKDEMERLATMLGTAGESLQMLPKLIEDSTINIVDMTDQLGSGFKENISELQNGQENIILKQNESFKITEEMLSALKENIIELSSLSTDMRNTSESISQVDKEFNQSAELLRLASKHLNSTSETMQTSQTSFVAEAENITQSNSDLLGEYQSTIDDTRALAKEYTENFKIIEEGLQGIFKEMESGLNSYRDTVGSSLGQYLDKYSDSLTKTTDSLAGASSTQQEILEELVVQLDSLKNNGNSNHA